MLEELVYMILRGMIIGIVVSAPMGPVGIFCIQRTLDKGRHSGFFTGVGAAVSDLIYCILTGFCLSFIEGFITDHRGLIQIIGSSVLIGFGIWLIKKKPDSTVAADSGQELPSVEGDILKGFALTFSNPLILFLIIGLFAQFNFVIEGMTFWHYVLGFIGIIAGALGWWWVVTFFVDKIRGHFTRRTMKLINTIVGIIILVFAAIGILSATSVYAHGASASRMKMSASFRVSDKSVKGWKAEFADSLGNGFVFKVLPANIGDPFGDSDRDVLKVCVEEIPTRRNLGEITVKDNIDPYKGSNSWRVMREGSTWRLYAGNRDYRLLMAFDMEMGKCREPWISPAAQGDVEVMMMELDYQDGLEIGYIAGDIQATLRALSEHQTDIAGMYSLFDYDQDDSYASLGGQYRLAVLPAESSSDNFDIVYVAGARIYGNEWKEGMRKGVLKATPFGNVYDVEWVDAEGEVMRQDVQADFDPLNQLLTIRFPYQNTTLRFRKMR